ncbi:MAG: hypothetical protein J0653_06925 [Deltaproteobacteria bacterium]|nr:hypothetical protein [Deltaproteobacteria bacterium]
MSSGDGKTGRVQLQRLLNGEPIDRTLRGEIWPLPDGGTADEIVAVAKTMQADYCFFDRVPGVVGKAHALGLAAGAIVNGPWQRWMVEVGWQEAMLQLAKESDLLRQGLASAARQAEQEIEAWLDAGVDLVLLDIAYAAGPYMSPQQLERFLLPLYQAVVARGTLTGVSVGFHSDGCVDLLLPGLRQANFRFYSLEPEGTDPIRAWNILGTRIPLFSGLPANWLTPSGFFPNREGETLHAWLSSGPLVVSSACGLYHAEAAASLRDIYQWLDRNNK